MSAPIEAPEAGDPPLPPVPEGAVMVSLLPCSSLGDIYGYRRVYGIGLAVFTVASLACALVHSLPLPGRDFIALASLAPGFTGNPVAPSPQLWGAGSRSLRLPNPCRGEQPGRLATPPDTPP